MHQNLRTWWNWYTPPSEKRSREGGGSNPPERTKMTIKEIIDDIRTWWFLGPMSCPTPKCSCHRYMIGQQAAYILINRWPRFEIETTAAGWWHIDFAWFRFMFKKSEERCRLNFIKEGRERHYKSHLRKTKIAERT